MTFNSQNVQDIVILVVSIGGSFAIWKSRVPAQTIKNLEESNKSYVELDKARQASINVLEKKIKEVTDKHTEERVEWTKAIADLNGQIKVYKELPLRELADGMKIIAASNAEILNTLKTSAITLTADTRDAAVAVAEVKSDLKHT